MQKTLSQALIASRQFVQPGSETRTVVFVQPMDRAWIDQLAERTGMVIRTGRETENRDKKKISVSSSNQRQGSVNIDVDDDGGENGLPAHLRPKANTGRRRRPTHNFHPPAQPAQFTSNF